MLTPSHLLNTRSIATLAFAIPSAPAGPNPGQTCTAGDAESLGYQASLWCLPPLYSELWRLMRDRRLVLPLESGIDPG